MFLHEKQFLTPEDDLACLENTPATLGIAPELFTDCLAAAEFGVSGTRFDARSQRPDQRRSRVGLGRLASGQFPALCPATRHHQSAARFGAVGNGSRAWTRSHRGAAKFFALGDAFGSLSTLLASWSGDRTDRGRPGFGFVERSRRGVHPGSVA